MAHIKETDNTPIFLLYRKAVWWYDSCTANLRHSPLIPLSEGGRGCIRRQPNDLLGSDNYERTGNRRLY